MLPSQVPARAVLSLFALAAAALGGTLLSSLLAAGPLDPPAGPVTSTYKTLTEIEPRIAINQANTPGDSVSMFRITQPGSYYLTTDILSPLNHHAITIAAAHVSIDLRGYHLRGFLTPTFSAITTSSPSLSDISISNGTISGWHADAIDFNTNGPAVSCRFTDLTLTDNAGFGIRVGDECSLTNCIANSNTFGGIVTGKGCTITNCSANHSPGIGINTGSGITVSNGCTVTNCTAASNNSTGIRTGLGCTVSNCSVSENVGSGIFTVGGSSVINCSALSNTLDGITADDGCTLSNCSAYQNTASGISVNAGCTVADCTVHLNSFDGIRCGASCVIRGNTCASNGFFSSDGAGIHATNTNNRIEGNNCTNADRGIAVDFAGNFIIRNTCSDNPVNWIIVADNYYGPIIDRIGIATAAVNGAAAAGTLTSTDPNANFSY